MAPREKSQLKRVRVSACALQIISGQQQHEN